MIEECTPNVEMRLPKSRNWKNTLVKWSAGNLLHWHPVGSLLVRLPDGEELRFGSRNGDDEPLLILKNYKVLAKSIRRGSIGFAEAYINGDITCEDLTGLIRFFLANQESFEKTGSSLFKVRLPDRIAHLIKRNSRKGSRRNISDHYDLGNEFFQHWLDSKMVYSSGYFAKGARSLDEAQNAKIDLILGMLHLKKGENLLEIGCGWGAFANTAANNFGAKVKGITLSQEQLNHSRENALDLKPQPEFLLEDYRDTKGKYDHIVSIEMIEAVGESYWKNYFETLYDRLKPGGSAVIQAITIDESRYDQYRRQADFIQRYIFPGGMLPTKTIIEQMANAAGLKLEKRILFGQCYARTLIEWRDRFEAAWPQIADLGFDESFKRTWHYYLSYCEAGFAEGLVDVGAYQLRR